MILKLFNIPSLYIEYLENNTKLINSHLGHSHPPDPRRFQDYNNIKQIISIVNGTLQNIPNAFLIFMKHSLSLPMKCSQEKPYPGFFMMGIKYLVWFHALEINCSTRLKKFFLKTTIIEMFILFADFIFKSVFINLKVTHLEWFFLSLGTIFILYYYRCLDCCL